MKYRSAATMIILSLLLTAVSGQVLADGWGYVYDFGDRKLYLRLPVPKYTGAPIRVWSLITYKKPKNTDGKIWQSWVHLEEFDCAGGSITSRDVTYYPKAMGIGAPVQSFSEDETSPVQPGTMGETIFQLVCKG